MSSEPDWLRNFKITKADLERLIEWLKEGGQPVTTEQITRRIIRGRLRYGTDESPAALPGWVKEQHVLSWDEMDKWCVGCRVLVARRINDQIAPRFGVIQAITQYFEIQFEDERISYKRVTPGSADAQTYYKYIRESIWQQERQQSQDPKKGDFEKQVDLILLNNGARIASDIISALNQDKRFIAWNEHWCLRELLISIDIAGLRNIHQELFTAKRHFSLEEILALVSELPKDALGMLSLATALSEQKDLFIEREDGWYAKLPQWNQAIGAYYVYDPRTFEIVLKPGEPLTQNIAERLTELGFYADVVQLKV